MTETVQPTLFADSPEVDAVVAAVREVLKSRAQPSAWELLGALEGDLGMTVRWVVTDAVQRLVNDPSVTHSQQGYLRDLLMSADWQEAMRGSARPGREIESTIDAMFRESAAYRSTAAFQEMVSFMANFRDCAPFNNMLVRLQKGKGSRKRTSRSWLSSKEADACALHNG